MYDCYLLLVNHLIIDLDTSDCISIYRQQYTRAIVVQFTGNSILVISAATEVFIINEINLWK